MPGRPFPARFSYIGWAGPRAADFPSREDAFQQLVGDGLTTQFGAQAHVVPTLGRDGGIDGWIDSDDPAVTVFEATVPAIVECKDHDDTLLQFQTNVQQGWRKVADKLRKQAEAGWPGAYQPWKVAVSYVYCVSSVLPSIQARTDLEQQIRAFFADLPKANRPPIQRVRVLDWQDLRAWLDRQPGVADRWLGVGLDLVIPLDTYIAGLTGFQGYLLQNELAFVPPPAAAPFHPQAVLHELAGTASQAGVLLVAAGGIGKTRTALETAKLAQQQGWRVLYALPGEPGIDAEMLAQAVLAGSGPTLVVSDYLDQAQRLDLGVVRRSLLPQALAKGIRLAFLATTRPGWMAADNHERDALFPRPVAVAPAEVQRDAIAARMIHAVAAGAIRVLGEAEVARVCGSRPILALFIARELQRQAKEGSLQVQDVTRVRGGDLLHWLRRRLAADGIEVKRPAAVLLPAEPEPHVTAAAAILGAVPLQTAELVAVATTTLARTAAGNAEATAHHLVNALDTLGWLEVRGPMQIAAHDVVVDEVLEQVLLDHARVRQLVLAAVLAQARTTSRVFGRFATALGRLSGQLDANRADALRQAAAIWLEREAPTLAATLAHDDPDEAAYATGAALAGPPWSTVMVEHWAVLLGPLLTANGSHPTMRHLHYMGLRTLPAGAAPTLVQAALVWLDAHPCLPVASFVVGPLLAREDLARVQTDAAVAAAQVWLGEHPKAAEAGFVVAPVLAREELAPVQKDAAVAAAQVWLGEHPKAAEAQFVLRPLLNRQDLAPVQKDAGVAAAQVWLGEHPKAAEARFVLRPLLSRQDLAPVQKDAGVAAAQVWLGEHPKTAEAGFVLAPLLARQDLAPVQKDAAVAAAQVWLGEHPKAAEAGFVLAPLLARQDLAPVQKDAAVAAVQVWLGEHPKTAEAQFVLRPLLSRQDLAPVQKDAAVAAVQVWLGEHPKAAEAGFVLAPLLARQDLSVDAAEAAIVSAIRWVDVHAATQDAEFVFRRLFRRIDLEPSRRSALALAAISRLRLVLADDEATFMLRALLGDRMLPSDVVAAVMPLALIWLDGHRGDAVSDFVFHGVLNNPAAKDEQWRPAASHALEWLRAHHGGNYTDRTLNALLKRPNLLQADEIAFITERTEVCQGPAEHVQRLRARLVRLGAAAGIGAGPEARRQKDTEWTSLTAALENAAVAPKDAVADRQHVARGVVAATDMSAKSPGAAGFAIAPLLAIATRTEAADLRRVVDLAKRLAADDRLTDRQALGIAHAIGRQVKAGTVRDEDVADLMETLGLFKQPV
jgi:hypothetical protein